MHSIGRAKQQRWRLLVAVAGIAVATLIAGDRPLAQDSRPPQRFNAGQNVAPSFDGWEKNPDGSFNMLFGYFNRNWEEQPQVPVGPDNNIEPGGPDQGQPTTFFPRRNW